MRILKNLFFVLLLIPFISTAQNNDINEIDFISQQLIKNLRSVTKEKIFLQTNKKIYFSEETIWFKVYTTDSLSTRLTNKSKILYVDLVDAKDHVINRRVLDVNNAEQTGAVSIDSSLSGYYWLRAYTAGMVKNDISGITVKPLYIVSKEGNKKNNLSAETGNNVAADTKLTIEIFPEGGELIGGANSVVAVKAHTATGKGLTISGIVKDSRDTIVAKFTTNGDGLGKFAFSPSSFQKYKIYVLNNGRYDSVLTLPRVNPFAAQLAVTGQNQQYITATVLLEDSVYTKNYKTYVIGINRDSVCFAAVGKGMYEFNIPVSNFPSGVASLLLFNSSRQLTSVRNVYINKTNVNVDITTNKQNYGARENAQMNIAVTDEKGKSVLATFSVSVTNGHITDTINDFYNNTLDKIFAEDADLIMLTQQQEYAAYWMNIYTGKNLSSTEYGHEELTVQGLLVNRKQEPVPNKEVMLMPVNQDVFILQDTTDNYGKFSFSSAGFNNGTPFRLQVNDAQGTKDNYDAVLDSSFSYDFRTPAALKKKFPADEIPALKKIDAFYTDSIINGKGWLPPVTVTGETNKRKTDFNSGDIITKEMLNTGVNNLGDAILRNGKFHILQGYLMAGGPNGFAPSASDEPTVVFDGVQITTSEKTTDAGTTSPVLTYLKGIPLSQIDHIKILTGASAGIYGVRSGHGVIEIYTAPSAGNAVSSAGLKIIYPKGFDVPPVFDMPDYTNKQAKNSKNADMRTTLYWNGNIITDNNGKATINFFTADIPAVYIVIISGITANGDKIFKTITINRSLK